MAVRLPWPPLFQAGPALTQAEVPARKGAGCREVRSTWVAVALLWSLQAPATITPHS